MKAYPLRIPEWLRLKGTSEAHLAQAHAQEVPPSIAGCWGLVSRWLLNNLQEWRIHSLPGEPMLVLSCSQEQTECFFDDQTEPLVLQLVPIASGPATEKSLALFSWYAPSRYWYTLERSPLSLLFSILNSPSSCSLSSQEKCSSPFITFVAVCWTFSSMLMSLLYWGAQCWTQHSRCNLWQRHSCPNPCHYCSNAHRSVKMTYFNCM